MALYILITNFQPQKHIFTEYFVKINILQKIANNEPTLHD